MQPRVSYKSRALQSDLAVLEQTSAILRRHAPGTATNAYTDPDIMADNTMRFKAYETFDDDIVLRLNQMRWKREKTHVPNQGTVYEYTRARSMDFSLVLDVVAWLFDVVAIVLLAICLYVYVFNHGIVLFRTKPHYVPDELVNAMIPVVTYFRNYRQLQ